jgi:hypothetical protein
MLPREVTYTKSGNLLIIVEYSLMNKIDQILSTIYECSSNRLFIIGIRHMRNRMVANITTNNDLYLQRNRKLILDIYRLFKNRTTWENDFIFDYNIFYEEGHRYFPLPEIDEMLTKINDVVAQLEEIIRLDYVKMKKNNMKFAEDLAKCVFNPKRMTKISEKYGLNDFTEYLDILD